MIEFILNNELVSTDEKVGMPVLDFIRTNMSLKGTKIGCREGDCGACTILVGEIIDGNLFYKSMTSCLTPLLNIIGKHVVTIEGLSLSDLNIAQKELVESNGSQCGFCTPGFVVSMMSNALPHLSDINDCSIDGNICRCTGYKSIQTAYDNTQNAFNEILKGNHAISNLVNNNVIPKYFLDIQDRLNQLVNKKDINDGTLVMGGGTDLLVQKSHIIKESDICHVNLTNKGIHVSGDEVIMSANTTASQIMNSTLLQSVIPNLKNYFKLVSSSPIRNMGTIAGNIVNASPIGDLTIFFLALNAKIMIKSKVNLTRFIFLKDFYIGYKKIDLNAGEFIESIHFNKKNIDLFNFEKVSKRKHLDIASVNTAISLQLDGQKIVECHISCGGVGPIPQYLENTRGVLLGHNISKEIILKSMDSIDEDIAPISDIRGTADYKRKLLKRLFLAHFIELFPSKELNLFN